MSSHMDIAWIKAKESWGGAKKWVLLILSFAPEMPLCFDSDWSTSNG
jgi:hypothetical protein